MSTCESTCPLIQNDATRANRGHITDSADSATAGLMEEDPGAMGIVLLCVRIIPLKRFDSVRFV